MDNTFNPSAEILLEEAPQQKFPWLNVVLFVLTCLTTMVTGTFLMTSFNNTFTGFSGFFREVFRSPSIDRKSTRLNSSHQIISYAVFCLKKKRNKSTYHI